MAAKGSLPLGYVWQNRIKRALVQLCDLPGNLVEEN
jgi:hypothetical protein